MAEKARVLVVDDEVLIVKLLGKHLEAAGFEVLSAFDGQQGLEKARGERPELIILDLILPKLNGYEVCTLLKQDARYQHIPIVVCTAKVQEQDEALGMQCGANVYLRKPLDIRVLLDHVTRLARAPRAPSRDTVSS